MSSQRPGSWSLTKTPAVMCIADTRTIPSWMPLAEAIRSTSSVMLTSSRRSFVSNQRYSVFDRMVPDGSYQVCARAGSCEEGALVPLVFLPDRAQFFVWGGDD